MGTTVIKCWPPTWLLLFGLIGTWTTQGTNGVALCPDQCSCQENAMTCTCEDKNLPELIISSLGEAFITTLSIHSCDQVTVLNGSFTNAKITQRLSFSKIKNLKIEPFAFSGIGQSPQILIIEESHMKRLEPMGLAGLTHVEHVWVRSSTIDDVAADAFALLFRIGYVYFHRSHIRRIHRRAFGNMSEVGQVYFKGDVRIDSVEGGAFADSVIYELVVEGAHLDDVASTFLAGLRCHEFVAHNSTLHFAGRVTDDEVDYLRTPSAQKGLLPRCKLTNVKMNVFDPFLLGCVDLKVIGSNLSQIVQYVPENTTKSYSKQATFTFVNSTIVSIEDGAFARRSMDVVVFEHCVVDDVQKNAFVGATIATLKFGRTRIKKIHSEAFSNLTSTQLVIDGSDVDVLEECGFARTRIANLTINASKLGDVGKAILENATLAVLRITSSRFVRANPRLLHKFDKIKTMWIVENDLATHGRLHPLLPTLTPVHQPVVITLANNTLDCSAVSCEYNRFLTDRPRHDLLWRMSANRCRPPSGVCDGPRSRSFVENGVSCELVWTTAECRCTGAEAVVPLRRLASLAVSVLVLGDCSHVILDEDNYEYRSPIYRGPFNNTLSAIYVFRSQSVVIKRIPDGVEVLNFIQVHGLDFFREPLSQRLEQMQIVDTTLRRMGPHGLSGLHVVDLNVTRSRLAVFPRTSTTGAVFERLTIASSSLEESHALFCATRRLVMTNNVVFTTLTCTSNIDSLELYNNTMLCCCGTGPRRPSCPEERPGGEPSLKPCEEHFPGTVCPALKMPHRSLMSFASAELDDVMPIDFLASGVVPPAPVAKTLIVYPSAAVIANFFLSGLGPDL